MWLITACSYLRMRRAGIREPVADESMSTWGRLDDDVWHRHRAAYWRACPGGFLIHLLPMIGPRGGEGVTTGRVEAAVLLDRDQLVEFWSVRDHS